MQTMTVRELMLYLADKDLDLPVRVAQDLTPDPKHEAITEAIYVTGGVGPDSVQQGIVLLYNHPTVPEDIDDEDDDPEIKCPNCGEIL